MPCNTTASESLWAAGTNSHSYFSLFLFPFQTTWYIRNLNYVKDLVNIVHCWIIWSLCKRRTMSHISGYYQIHIYFSHFGFVVGLKKILYLFFIEKYTKDCWGWYCLTQTISIFVILFLSHCKYFSLSIKKGNHSLAIALKCVWDPLDGPLNETEKLL